MKWKDCFIGDLVDKDRASIQTGPFGTQLKASDYIDEGTPVINVRNIGYGALRPDKLEYVGEQTTHHLSAHLLRERDIVFGRKGAVDRHLFVTKEHENWMQGSDCIRLRFTTDEVCPRFVSYAFLRNEHQQWMLTQSGNKATMASLNQDIIRRIPLCLPPHPIQEKVVSILSAYDDFIENCLQQITLLEESARLLYQDWFLRLRFPGREHTPITKGIPQGWERVPTTEAVDVNPRTILSDEEDQWYVEMADLPINSMVIQNAVKRSGRSGSKFRNGDTLLARITPCLENGKTAFVNFMRDGEAGRGSTEFIVLRSKRLTPEFVYCLARTYSFRENAIKSMIGASGRQRVQESCFDKFMVWIPPAPLLKLFSDYSEPIFQKIKILHSQSHKLRAARDLLLPRLMSGQIAL
jgi:type I restriction enzyme, S subunit